MKKIIIGDVIFFVVALLTSQSVQAQGVVYLSNLGQSSAGSDMVGSDSWLAAGFFTGTNSSGYILNSIQLAMTNATGNPSGFTVMLYSAIPPSSSSNGEFFPGSNLGALNGSLNPTTAGIYSYDPSSSLSLAPSTAYFLALTAGTSVANGAYEWDLANANYNPTGGWHAPPAVAVGDNYQSSDGSSWGILEALPQFAINATAIPEPGVLGLLGLGGLCFFWHCRRLR